MKFFRFIGLVILFFCFLNCKIVFADKPIVPTFAPINPPGESWRECQKCEFPFTCSIGLEYTRECIEVEGGDWFNDGTTCSDSCCNNVFFCDEEKSEIEKCQIGTCCSGGICRDFGESYIDECGGQGGFDNGSRNGNGFDPENPPTEGIDLWLTICGETYPAWVWSIGQCGEWLVKHDGHCYPIEPTPRMKFYNQCNDNEPTPGVPLPGETLPVDPFLPVVPCYSSTYPETDPLPECVINNTCWEKPEICAANCQMYWYCNEVDGSCRNGFFRDMGDCNVKNPMGCFETMDQCFDVCNCITGNNCGATACVGEFCDNGCGGWDEGAMTCAPGLVPFVPSGEKIEIGNGGGAMNLVSSDGNGRTHICDPGFWNNPVELPNKAYFRVMISDQVSAQRIDVIALAFSNGSTGDDLVMATVNLAADEGSALGMITSVYGNGEDEVSVTAVTENLKDAPEVLNRTMTFVVTYGPNFPINLNYIWVTAMDVMGNTLPWTYTDASFKYWDCKVDFEGKLYDDSEVESVSCPVSGWKTEASETVNFNSLSFVNVGNTGDTLAATIVGDNSFSGSGLIWGKTYSSNFNEDINCDIVSVLARLIDVGSVGTTSCMANSQINTLRKYDLTIPEYSIDPFVDDPKVQIDYSIAQFADPWYQIEGGGLQALGSIGNYVRSPMKMVVDADGNDAGWIAAGGYRMIVGRLRFSELILTKTERFPIILTVTQIC